ncbi:O-antigen polysaccharide polymerase Wzy family protein [Ureibacillus thermosphaericus]|uniref:O-antigen polysaccharide polymerase Wzy family protein n=1 Tax=Ureibacillus thermosphaericus TaxID=51173 RepID=UPI000BBC8B3B|nr:O-antigen polysaccharide polymerase Wzy family protein [Ureibacillus thermosphaericus]
MLTTLRNILFFGSILVFIMGILTKDINSIIVSVLMLLIQNFWFAIEKFSERVIFFSFNFTLLIFVLGRPFISDLFNYQYSEKGYYGTGISDIEVIINTFIGIYISMFFLYLGNLFMEKRLLNNKILISFDQKKINTPFWIYFKVISKYTFYFLLVFRFLYLKESISFVEQSGYFELYNSFTSNLPIFVIKLSEMYILPLIAFLILRPTKKEAAIPILLFLIEGVFSLGTGKRFGFVLNIIIILIYFALRNRDSVKRWLGKKEIIVTIIAMPTLAVVLNIVNYKRLGLETTTQTFSNLILEFFYKQGVTLSTLAHSVLYNEVYPNQNTLYSIGTITEFLKKNTITQLFFDFPVYTGQTVERALNGDLFSHRISYFIIPSGYLQGRGYGSSYIAELYVDFGFLGIAIGSFLLGVLFVVLYKWYYRSPITSLFSLLLIRNLMMIARSETTSFITASVTLGNIVCLIFLLFFTYVIYNLLEGNRFRFKTSKNGGD